MPDPNSTDRVALGEHIFDLETGELTSREATAPSRRLAPQPAKLLGLLIAKQGGLLSRAEIQATLWSDVAVDVDQSLSFCVRQVRVALGDSADAPRYVETLPRRGYRLLVDPVPLVHPPDEPLPVSAVVDASDADPPSPPARAARRWGRLLTIIALAVATTSGMAWLGKQPNSSEGPQRLAIMPFAPPEGVEAPGDPTQVGWALLAALGGGDLERLVVVGPTTTRAYASDLRSVARLAGELNVDFVMNGRFIEGEDGPALLAELIRAADGAHVWVKAYPIGTAEWSIAATEIERAIRTHVLVSNE